MSMPDEFMSDDEFDIHIAIPKVEPELTVGLLDEKLVKVDKKDPVKTMDLKLSRCCITCKYFINASRLRGRAGFCNLTAPEAEVQTLKRADTKKLIKVDSGNVCNLHQFKKASITAIETWSGFKYKPSGERIG